MSSNYVVLDNRPINQWKVTELKEELKRRKLVTRGLKEDLVRRLDAAIQSEMEAVKEKLENDVVNPLLMSQVMSNEDKIDKQTVDSSMRSVASNSEKANDDVTMVDIDINNADTGQEAKVQELESSSGIDANDVAQDATENVMAMETSAVDNQGMLNQEELGGEKELKNNDILREDEKTSNPSPSEDVKPSIFGDPNDNQVSKASAGMTDNINASNVNPSKKNDGADGGDVDKSEIAESHALKLDSSVDVVTDSSPEKKNALNEKNNQEIASEKRKLEDKETPVNNEPVKRQRRWNSEALRLSESQNLSQTPLSTPHDTFPPKLTFNRFNSTNGRDTPKERIVPPSQKPTTNFLRIDHFLRPFTLKGVQELLAKTGTVTDFWMDHIKTHCFVTYSSVEEAIDTRNALYNLQWPPKGGRLLVAEFVDAQEVESHLEAPTSPAQVSTLTMPSTPEAPIQTPHQNALRQHLPSPPSLPPPPPPILESPPAREKVTLLPPPPKKPDPPIVTLDDLFKKTKSTPRIYYLPLSKEQVVAKHAAQGKKSVRQ
ncbi:uncharacterized protein [Aristolochia californica]|uniref:uncharacterized protein isoform X2 n=1 Tax=Aristolochia californica TaxID=171875 RepID=UPI0035DEE8FF